MGIKTQPKGDRSLRREENKGLANENLSLFPRTHPGKKEQRMRKNERLERGKKVTMGPIHLRRGSVLGERMSFPSTEYHQRYSEQFS